ncbi:hypothetical protein GDO81_020812 [Engystomops pustulosus]|uniref:Secreted protein n=1 Tax=Engystomops pustulosus TaxID=76066 RepID=A0AAV6Z7M4_ENGPU|nr:hypothetical protein GDO81_020812 [Engystomops pustulosus]
MASGVGSILSVILLDCRHELRCQTANICNVSGLCVPFNLTLRSPFKQNSANWCPDNTSAGRGMRRLLIGVSPHCSPGVLFVQTSGSGGFGQSCRRPDIIPNVAVL